MNGVQAKKVTVTPDNILNFIGLGPFQVLAFLLSGFTYLTYGCDGSIFIFLGKSISKEWNISTTSFAFLPAATGLPNVVGGLIFSYLSDRFGRLWPYAICMAWIGVFSVASAFSKSFVMLIVLRCLASVGIGGVVGFVNPTVIEFLPVRNRGTVIVLNMMMGSMGTCLSCGLAWWLIPSYPNFGWRYYIIAAGIPAMLVAVFRLIFFVESPRFLVANGKSRKAWKIFETMAKINGKRLSDCFSPDINCISLCENRKEQPFIFLQLLHIFRPIYLRRTIPIAIIVITEVLGFLSSQLFLPNYLEKVGVGAYATIMFTSVAQIPGIVLLSIIVEWPEIGRLNSFRIYSAIAAILFLLLAFIQNDVAIPIFLTIIYFFTAPILGLIYAYISESYPTSIRSITTTFFYIFQALTYIVGALLISRAVNMPQHWLFPTVFAGCFFVQFIMSLILNYEPFGRELQDTIQ